MRVLMVASEFSPLIKVGGLADVVGSLPKALRDIGIDVRVILPAYSSIAARKSYHGIPLYFIKSHQYFEEIYPGGELESEQFAFFSKAVVDWLLTGEFVPDLIHCHDYHTALIPDILAQRGIKIPTLLTIHDFSNTGNADVSILESANMLKRGLYTASVVSTVSPTYAKEILPLVGGREIEGILNGIDYDVFNPKKDKFLTTNLRSSLPAWKRRSKASLQEELGLKVSNLYKPVAMITRLTERKGVRIFVEAVVSLLEKDNSRLQVIVLGVGDPLLEKLLKKADKKYSQFRVIIDFDEGLAHRIYAGSDFFCVPSLFEPCGLTQMIAMRYGCLPIVRKTGGLIDSVNHLKDGLVFDGYTVSDVRKAVKRGLSLSNSEFSRMRISAQHKDFSWGRSAKQYKKLYKKVVNSNKIYNFKDSSVVFAPLRMKRPHQKKMRKKICLFCPGSEHLISPEIASIKSHLGGWKVRVIPNRYPIFNIHEVIITTRKHGVDLVNLSRRELQDVFTIYRDRARFYEPEDVLIYHNFGIGAGASLLHSHSQLVVVPKLSKASYPALERSPLNIIKTSSKNFMAYCPKDSKWGWETVITYKYKTLEFSKLRDSDVKELADLFLATLKSIYKNSGVSFDKWNYNFFITPGRKWQLRIIPRLEIPAGLELGSGIEVDAIPPDYAAQKSSQRI